MMEVPHREEIERLYLQMYDMLFQYARYALNSDALAEDAVQDTFSIACQKPEALYTNPNPEGWVFNTLKHVISNTIRSQHIARRILINYFAVIADEISTFSDSLSPNVLYHNVAETAEFQLLQERVLDGKTYSEMAQERGITEDACRKRMQRAIAVLSRRIRL